MSIWWGKSWLEFITDGGKAGKVKALNHWGGMSPGDTYQVWGMCRKASALFFKVWGPSGNSILVPWKNMEIVDPGSDPELIKQHKRKERKTP